MLSARARNIGAGRDQNFGHGEVAVLRRGVQSGPASVLAGVDGRSMVDQQRDDGRMRPAAAACSGRFCMALVERAQATRLCSSSAAAASEASEKRGQMQRRPAIRAHGGDQRPISGQQLLDARGYRPRIAAAKIASEGSASTRAWTRAESPARTASYNSFMRWRPALSGGRLKDVLGLIDFPGEVIDIE